MVDVGNFHIPLGPLMIIDGVFNMNVNPGLINHGLLFGGGTPPIITIWYLNGTPHNQTAVWGLLPSGKLT